jgi:hypothetical protein
MLDLSAASEAGSVASVRPGDFSLCGAFAGIRGMALLPSTVL